ncbi:MAG: hypothetical protein HQM05_17955 [Magnetococcales bacterium]|nr:hypothetical protein [Magnetococcales bacterium]
MSGLHTCQNLNNLAIRLRSDLNDRELILFHAYNRTSKSSSVGFSIILLPAFNSIRQKFSATPQR